MRCIANTKNSQQCKRNTCNGKLCGQHRKLRTDIELVNIEKANDGKHKFVAHFIVNGKEQKTKFGAEGYGDFILFSKNEGKESGLRHREHYIQRHAKDLRTNDFTRAGVLSMFILWGNKPNLEESIKDYRRRIKNHDLSLPK
jgi:hypothetical protein